MTARLNVIKVRVPVGAGWQEAVNRAIDRVEIAGGRVLQVVDRHFHSFDASATRKTEDCSVTLLVETSDG